MLGGAPHRGVGAPLAEVAAILADAALIVSHKIANIIGVSLGKQQERMGMGRGALMDGGWEWAMGQESKQLRLQSSSTGDQF